MAFATMFEGQARHALGLVVLLVAAVWAVSGDGAPAGSLWGVSASAWFALLLADTVLHQVFVAVAWRLELHGQHLSRWFGDTERAFRSYAAVFAVLFVGRFVLVTLLAVANRGTFPMTPWLGWVAGAVIAVPAVYLFYSVRTWFGFRRAFGIDHFDPAARNWPMVREGIFRYTANGMYVFGIGALWIPGLLFQSWAALVGAAFSHAYIWVHFFTVERPDMRRIYGS